MFLPSLTGGNRKVYMEYNDGHISLTVSFGATAWTLQPYRGRSFLLPFTACFFLKWTWCCLGDPTLHEEEGLGRQDSCFQEVTDDCAALSDHKAGAWVLNKRRSYSTCLRTIPVHGLYGSKQKTQLLRQLLTSVALISCRKDAPRPARSNRAPKLVKSHSPAHPSSSSL